MLRLIIYKKKACIYLVGGTKEAILTFGKDDSIFQLCGYLSYHLNKNFWNTYQGIFHKGKFYEASDAMETAKLIEKLIKGELK